MSYFNIFEWSAWDGFLITFALPEAKRVKLVPGSQLMLTGARDGPAFLHVNLSQPESAFPDYGDWLLANATENVPVVNGYCTSIDKWAVQEACAQAGLPHVRAPRDGDPDEVLIIKARANYGGLFEGRLPLGLVGDLAPPPWPYPERVQLFMRREIDEAIWSDARITVERYITNPAGRFRRTYVFGHYVAAATSSSADVLKRMDHRAGVEFVSTQSAKGRPYDTRDPISVTYRLAQAMRLDFAALDLAVDGDGNNYPIDVNTTPAWGNDHNPRLVCELGQAAATLSASGSLYATTS